MVNSMDPNDTPEGILKKYFGYQYFRRGQREIIENIVAGRDAVCIMPTGAGKSICYQVAALLREGVTIVVSPLISLMINQVQTLVGCGVKAAYINSALSPRVIEKVLKRVACGEYKIIYVAPERLNTSGFLSAVEQLNVSILTVDEAHCISRWGHDFRPSYLEIVKFIENLKKRPTVCAFTATATGDVKRDICEILKLNNPYIKTTSFDRENLFFDVKRPMDKDEELLEFLEKRRSKSGIVYCATRQKTENVCAVLKQNGFSATLYHAGLDETERAKNQDDFIFDRKKIMVATNAFGMGIDKSNVSFVVHYNMPKDIESYYQEAGRAGRDGSSAECVLYFSESDVVTDKYLISQTEAKKEVEDNAYRLLRKMVNYCKTERCLRGFILGYFGEPHNENCGNCGNCRKSNYEITDVTAQTAVILKCMKALPRLYGKAMITNVLRGGKNKNVLKYGLDRNPAYGAMKNYTRSEIGGIIDEMINSGLILRDGLEYPVLKIADRRNAEKVKICAQPIGKTPTAEVSKSKSKLFSILKNLRFNISKRENVPAYTVFSNATLEDMCDKMPLTEDEFLNVNGVGQVKSERYGREFIEAINNYKKENREE